VEINALWYNALMIFADILNRTGEKQQIEYYVQLAKRVKKSFNQLFWDIDLGYLYDYIDGNNKDASLRPNQILALSLPFNMVPVENAHKILKIIEKKLYTPVGLRSLSPDDPKYRPLYGGDQYSRDSAYHQGTVWSWLLGPYITALVRYRGKAGKKKAEKVIQNIVPHLAEAGIGTVSEIFDAEAPNTSRGTIAQAWSVAELLRAYFEDVV
jgi:glycogen debranching enzyme